MEVPQRVAPAIDSFPLTTSPHAASATHSIDRREDGSKSRGIPSATPARGRCLRAALGVPSLWSMYVPSGFGEPERRYVLLDGMRSGP